MRTARTAGLGQGEAVASCRLLGPAGGGRKELEGGKKKLTEGSDQEMSGKWETR